MMLSEEQKEENHYYVPLKGNLCFCKERPIKEIKEFSSSSRHELAVAEDEKNAMNE